MREHEPARGYGRGSNRPACKGESLIMLGRVQHGH
jgi:hypothetical protein